MPEGRNLAVGRRFFNSDPKFRDNAKHGSATMKNAEACSEKLYVPIDAKVLLTTAEAAVLLGVSERTLHTLTKAGRIPSLRIPVQKGKRALVRYRRATLENWAVALERGQSLPSPDLNETEAEFEENFPEDLLE